MKPFLGKSVASIGATKPPKDEPPRPTFTPIVVRPDRLAIPVAGFRGPAGVVVFDRLGWTIPGRPFLVVGIPRWGRWLWPCPRQRLPEA